MGTRGDEWGRRVFPDWFGRGDEFGVGDPFGVWFVYEVVVRVVPVDVSLVVCRPY